MGVRSMPAEGERGSASSLNRWFVMVRSGLVAADILLSLDPMMIIYRCRARKQKQILYVVYGKTILELATFND